MYNQIKNKILLNPGPTNTSTNTKVAQFIGSDVCHRTVDFYHILKETKEMLLKRFFIGTQGQTKEDWTVALIGGSGTAAMEAMVSSLSPQNNVINIIAGKYGQRLSDIMHIYNVNHDNVYAQSFDELTKNEENKSLFFVENETTNGEKYKLENIVSSFPNAKLYVDATSAFGASHYSDNAISKINALSFCSNKCLQSTPGLGIVIWRKGLPLFNRSHYLNLSKYREDIPPFTIPVQSVYAMHTTLQESKDNTELFSHRSKMIISDLNELGISCINKNPSNSIMGFVHPNKSYEELRLFLLHRDIIIYSGIDGYENSFRIATMSLEFDKEYSYILKQFHESVH